MSNTRLPADLDPRRTPARKQVAAARLEGQVEAERFVEGTRMEVAMSLLDLRTTPAPNRPLDTQLLAGEIFTVYDEIPDMGLSWGQAERDGYVGYVYTQGLAEPGTGQRATITAQSAIVYTKPDIKSDLMGAYSFGCTVNIAGEEGAFHILETGAYLPKPYVAPLGGADFTGIAERFLGVPYMWGGRSSYGLDCSALVQLALQATGIDAPRDSDMQQNELGRPAEGPPERGDLVFWDGHVGIMTDSETLLHANAHHMAVALEPLEAARQRIAAETGKTVTAIRRL